LVTDREAVAIGILWIARARGAESTWARSTEFAELRKIESAGRQAGPSKL